MSAPLAARERRRYVAAYVFVGFCEGRLATEIIDDLMPRMVRPRHVRRLPSLVVHYYNQYCHRFPRIAAGSKTGVTQ